MPGCCLSFFTLRVPLVGAHLQAGISAIDPSPPSCGTGLWGQLGLGWTVPILSPPCIRALALPWVPPETAHRSSGALQDTLPSHHPYGNVAETEHFSPKDKNIEWEGFSCCSSPSEQTLQRQQRMEVTLWSCLVLSRGSVLINVDEFHCKTK